MLEYITKYPQTKEGPYDFTIIIPTWNNLDFVSNCIRSLEQNSTLKIQLIAIVNEGKDGTLEWFLSQNKIDFIHARKNIGICYALNIARSMVRAQYLVYANDDMYFLPGWDIAIMDEIKIIGHSNFMLSATMIEPDDTGNLCVSVGNYGKTTTDFDEKKLLEEYKNHFKPDWKGSTWPPNVVHIDMWDLVGGMSIEFSPGMYSDPDLSMKLYQAGVRHFKGIGKSLVYHFGSKSTKRVKKNKGYHTFLLKWGITSNTFSKQYLQRGIPWHQHMDIKKHSWLSKGISKLKRMKAAWI